MGQNEKNMGIEAFLKKYLTRGFVLSVIGAVVAVLGLVFGFIVGVVTLESLGLDSASIIESGPQSSIETGTLQLIGLMMAAVLFVFSNSLLAQIPFLGSYAGFTNSISKGIIEAVKAIVLVAVPLTIGLVVSTIIISQLMYSSGEIPIEIRDATIIGTMSVFPMVMFYQVSVQKLTM